MLLQAQSEFLSSDQKARLHDLERVVERNLVSFLEAGRALLEIRDERLYRAYGTWEQYCRRRFGISESRGLELVRSTEIAQHLLEGPANPDNGDAPLPADLAEDTSLHKLEPPLQCAVWRLASRITEKPTGHIVARIVGVIQGAIHQGSNGSAPAGHQPKRHQKQTYLPSLYRLAAGDTFNPQIVVLGINDPGKAYRCATACRTLIARCEAILRELQQRFPDL